jgi:hypothetical protein
MWKPGKTASVTVALLTSAVVAAASLAETRAAKPDRDRPSCEGVQAAIDHLPRAGGAVRLLGVTYRCNSSIVIDRDHVALLGQGSATVLRLAAHVNRPVLVVGQTTQTPSVTRRDIRVSNLAIDGDRAGEDYECSSGPCSPGDFLRNDGIALRRVTDVLIDHVSIKHASSAGLATEMGSYGVTVRDVAVSDSMYDGIAGFATRDSTFTRLRLDDNGLAGLSFDGRFDGNRISDAILARNRDVGLFMRESRSNRFTRLKIVDSGSFGLFLAQGAAPATATTGNAFSQMIVARSGRNPVRGGFGMRVNDATCVGNSLAHVTFVDNRDGGLSQAAAGLVKLTATTSQTVTV